MKTIACLSLLSALALGGCVRKSQPAALTPRLAPTLAAATLQATVGCPAGTEKIGEAFTTIFDDGVEGAPTPQHGSSDRLLVLVVPEPGGYLLCRDLPKLPTP